LSPPTPNFYSQNAFSVDKQQRQSTEGKVGRNDYSKLSLLTEGRYLKFVGMLLNDSQFAGIFLTAVFKKCFSYLSQRGYVLASVCLSVSNFV